MILSEFISDIMILSFIAFLPILISWPAISILKRKKCFFIVDYGLNIYSIILFTVLTLLCKPIFGPEGISMFIVDVFFLTIFSIVLNYSKLLVANKVTPKYISIGGILIILIITIIAFFFTPMFGE